MKNKTPDSLTIQQYLEGKLDSEAAHQLEKQALDDPFLSDALEGYSVYRDPAADLSILQRQLHERIVHLQENKKVFDLSWQRLSVASAAAVMFVSAGILFWMNTHNAPEQLASEIHKPVEVNVIDRDSVHAVISAKEEPPITYLQKDQNNSDRPTISTSKPGNSIEKKAVISPKVEETFAASSSVSPKLEIEQHTISAGRQSKVVKADESNAAREAATVSVNNAPKAGWQAYNKYLNVNTSKFKANPSLSGSVLLSFQVASDGKLTNIKILKSLSEVYDREALRIIREGSEWTPSLDGKAYESRVEVSFHR